MIEALINGKPKLCIVDTGASISLMSKDEWQLLKGSDSKKKDGSWRFCIDFRKLNEVTVKDAFPLPQVADLVDSLSGHKYFSTLDLASGYWQVPVEESSREKTAFVIPGGGHFEFLRMSFGLTNAVPTFQRLMSLVLEGLMPLRCLGLFTISKYIPVFPSGK